MRKSSILTWWIILSAQLTVSSKNTIYSILYLISSFIGGAILMITIGLEYLGLSILTIYIGAVSILFIFIIMIINVEKNNIKESEIELLPLGIIILIQIYYIINKMEKGWSILSWPNLKDWSIYINKSDQMKTIGKELYWDYGYMLLIISILLLITMIGVGSLGFEKNKQIKISGRER